MAKKPQKRKAPTSRNRPSKREAKLSGDNIFEHLKLESVRLISVESTLQIVDKDLPTHATIRLMPNAGISSTEKRLHANAFLQVLGKPGTPKDAEKCSTVTINVHYQCVYEVLQADPQAVMPFAARVADTAVLVMWPYLRELCNSITSKMGIPPIVIPMYSPPQASSEGLKAIGKELESLRKQVADREEP